MDKLDTKLYPVFKANKFYKPTDEIITQKTDLIIEANVTGFSQNFQNNVGNFYAFMEIENQNQNKSVVVYGNAQINSQNEKSNLTCHLDETNSTYEYQNLYLLPYSIVESADPLFEVIISTTIKSDDGPEHEPTDPDTTDPEPTDPDTTDPEPTDPDTTDPEPTDTDTTGPEPTDTDTTGPEPTDTDTTGPEPTDTDTTGPQPTDSDTSTPEPTPTKSSYLKYSLSLLLSLKLLL